MITAIDFGCHAIRAAHRSSTTTRHLTLFSERAEYAMLPAQESYREALLERKICFAECDESLVVFGNRAQQVRWLSRKPCASLFMDGGVPTTDAPARQILHLLTDAILPEPASHADYCCFTVPGGRGNTANLEFLSTLIRIRGFTPLVTSPAQSAILAAGHETSFTGVSVVMGAESTEVSICRFGMELANQTINVGGNWIDSEIARQFSMQTWDETGETYLDLEAVRDWKQTGRVHLRHGMSDRERTLGRLYGAALDQIAGAIRNLLQQPGVQSSLGGERLVVACAGGPIQAAGFVGLMTEHLVDHDVAKEILSVKIVDDPANAVVRGLLIHGELEQRRLGSGRLAA